MRSMRVDKMLQQDAACHTVRQDLPCVYYWNTSSWRRFANTPICWLLFTSLGSVTTAISFQSSRSEKLLKNRSCLTTMVDSIRRSLACVRIIFCGDQHFGFSSWFYRSDSTTNYGGSLQRYGEKYRWRVNTDKSNPIGQRTQAYQCYLKTLIRAVKTLVTICHRLWRFYTEIHITGTCTKFKCVYMHYAYWHCHLNPPPYYRAESSSSPDYFCTRSCQHNLLLFCCHCGGTRTYG